MHGLELCCFVFGVLIARASAECIVICNSTDYNDVANLVNNRCENQTSSLRLVDDVEIQKLIEKEVEKRLNCFISEPGWVALPNGYQYRVVGFRRSWNESRSFCLDMGGDLATVGIRSYSTRLRIARNVLAPRSFPYAWIGLTRSAGTWAWLDGVLATPVNIHWSPGQPDNVGKNSNCGAVWDATHNYLTDDWPCANDAAALCEKRIVC